jgi:hypothetical protein
MGATSFSIAKSDREVRRLAQYLDRRNGAFVYIIQLRYPNLREYKSVRTAQSVRLAK